uniref:Uncharacterized protein MANES_15G019800 n=1 Tax=Rhizophora mucronata TaxID=61149 RepID=A0A2P2IH21_RHIMU
MYHVQSYENKRASRASTTSAAAPVSVFLSVSISPTRGVREDYKKFREKKGEEKREKE